jgi:hypothetical protein
LAFFASHICHTAKLEQHIKFYQWNITGTYRKHSADDPLFPLLPPSSTSLHSLATLDHETASQQYSLNSRHGSESGESQKHPPPFSIGKKSSKKNVHATPDPIFPGYVGT